MTVLQKIIIKYVKQNMKGHVRTVLVGLDRVRVIDEATGIRAVLTANLFGDIMNVDTKQIIAVGDVPKNLDELMKRPYQLPTKWVEEALPK